MNLLHMPLYPRVFYTFNWSRLQQGAGLRNTSVTLMLYWDHMPLTGTLFQHSVAVDTFDCPGKKEEGTKNTGEIRYRLFPLGSGEQRYRIEHLRRPNACPQPRKVGRRYVRSWSRKRPKHLKIPPLASLVCPRASRVSVGGLLVPGAHGRMDRKLCQKIEQNGLLSGCGQPERLVCMRIRQLLG